MIDWTAVEDALRDWVVTGSGLADTSVYWAEQDGPRPAAPCIALRLAGVRQVGHDWLDVEPASAPVDGAEINQLARGVRACTLRLQCFAATATGSAGAVRLLDRVVSYLRLPAVGDALSDAGVGIGVVGPIQATDGVINAARFEPRAVLEVAFFLASEVSETGTFIEQADITQVP